MKEKELVSVVVITYKAENSIIETLNSIKEQTYSPLELIIAEDCSPDATAAKCEEWLQANGSRFVRSQLIINEKNCGISANTNIGVRNTTGKWIKIVGDDILLSDAIESNWNFACTHNAMLVTSQAIRFRDDTKEHIDIVPNDAFVFPKTNKEQFLLHIKTRLNAPSPTWFYRREIFDELNGYDEQYQQLDDMPFIFRFFKKGYCMHYLPTPTLLYRVTRTSLSSSQAKTGRQKMVYFQYRTAYFQEMVTPELKRNKLYATLIRKKILHKLYMKKIQAKDESIARYAYGALFTLLYKFENF